MVHRYIADCRHIILGFDVSGEMVEVGNQVTQFKPRELIYARSDQLTGGPYAEYAVVSEKVAALKPTHINHQL